MKNNVNNVTGIYPNLILFDCVRDILKHGRSRKFYCGSNERTMKKVTKGNFRNHSNSGKEAVDIIVEVLYQSSSEPLGASRLRHDCHNVPIHCPTTKNLELFV
jgi:hypothetical protein